MAKCACCEEDSLTEGNGCFEICPICDWEDDPVQNDKPTMSGGANCFSLREQREILRMIQKATAHYAYKMLMRTAQKTGVDVTGEVRTEHVNPGIC